MTWQRSYCDGGDLALAHEQLAHAIARLVRRREHRPALVEVHDLLDVVLAEPDAAGEAAARTSARAASRHRTRRARSRRRRAGRARATCVSHEPGDVDDARGLGAAASRDSISVTPPLERAAPRRARRDRSRCGDRGAAPRSTRGCDAGSSPWNSRCAIIDIFARSWRAKSRPPPGRSSSLISELDDRLGGGSGGGSGSTRSSSACR